MNFITLQTFNLKYYTTPVNFIINIQNIKKFIRRNSDVIQSEDGLYHTPLKIFIRK